MKKIFKYIITYIILFDLFYGISKLITDTLELENLQWISKTALIINCIGITAGIIQIICKMKNKTERNVILVLIILNVLIWGKTLISLINGISEIYFPPEYIVEKNDTKVVGYVYNGYETRVDYYKYKNIFTRENKKIYVENYGKGTFNPFEEEHEVQEYCYYDENGTMTKHIENTNATENSTSQNNISEENYIEILYEKKINEDISIRVVNKDYILAQRSLIAIQKTVDGGKNWQSQLNTSDGVMQISNGAKFTFIDENIGFINDPGLAGTNGKSRGLLVTVDGGKNFSETIIEQSNIEDLYIEDVPYEENGILKVKAYTIENSVEKYCYFYSEDNGITWKTM